MSLEEMIKWYFEPENDVAFGLFFIACIVLTFCKWGRSDDDGLPYIPKLIITVVASILVRFIVDKSWGETVTLLLFFAVVILIIWLIFRKLFKLLFSIIWYPVKYIFIGIWYVIKYIGIGIWWVIKLIGIGFWYLGVFLGWLFGKGRTGVVKLSDKIAEEKKLKAGKRFSNLLTEHKIETQKKYSFENGNIILVGKNFEFAIYNNLKSFIISPDIIDSVTVTKHKATVEERSVDSEHIVSYTNVRRYELDIVFNFNNNSKPIIVATALYADNENDDSIEQDTVKVKVDEDAVSYVGNDVLQKCIEEILGLLEEYQRLQDEKNMVKIKRDAE